MERSRSTLNEEFKTVLVGIHRFGREIQEAERLDMGEFRRFAADINRTADRLDRKVGEMLAATADDRLQVTVDPRAPAPEAAIVAARGSYRVRQPSTGRQTGRIRVDDRPPKRDQGSYQER